MRKIPRHRKKRTETKRKKGKGFVGTWDDKSGSEEENSYNERANVGFKAIDDEVFFQEIKGTYRSHSYGSNYW